MAEEQRCHGVLPSRRGVCARRGTTAVHPRALLALHGEEGGQGRGASHPGE